MKAAATILCNNILYRAKKDNSAVTPMKLQKLLYYACRDYMAKTGTPPISENFEVWKYGPVLPSVYWEFRAFGAKPITKYAKDAKGSALKVNEDKNPILSNILDVVWAKYKGCSGVELSRKTHQKESAWYKAFAQKKAVVSWEDMKSDTTG